MPSPAALSPAERFLLDFHDRLPGGSSQAFAGLPVADDQGLQHADTYQALVQRLQDGQTPPGAVLDLACGDGHLLGLLRASGRPLLGVDASTGELAAARARLGEAVPLHQARALALPLADASLAATTCHMALMLMEAPQRVLAQIRRVLQPGGRLLAVVPAAPGPGPADPATQAFMAALQAHPQRRSEWQAVQFGSAHWRGADALQALLQADFPTPRFTRLSGARRLSPAQAWHWFTGLYDLHLRPDTAWGPAQALFLERLAPQCDADGQTTLQHAYLLIDAATPRTMPP
jgi:ubiquinone/menaquinone biosynthesis C-methylase UbiE